MGIVTTTKVINRCVLGLAAVILAVAGIVPKFSALLTTIPQCVLGGATVSVFASIAMTGMKLVASAEMDYRNSSIVGLAAALGMGVSQATEALSNLPRLGDDNLRKISGSAGDHYRSTSEYRPLPKQEWRKKRKKNGILRSKKILERVHGEK